MKVSSIVIIWVVVASLICGETLRAAPKLGSKGKSIATRFVDAVGVRHITTFFAKPTDGGYSPARKAIAAGTLALACSWGTISVTGCGTGYNSTHSENTMRSVMYLYGGVIVGVAVGALISGIEYTDNRSRHHKMFVANLDSIEQHRLGRGNLLSHSMVVDNDTYRGVLITYRDGADTRTGLAFSPQAPLVFSTQDEQGMLGFMANGPSFQPPEEITVKHLDGKTPNKLINLAQVEDVVLTEELVSQEPLLGEE